MDWGGRKPGGAWRPHEAAVGRKLDIARRFFANGENTIGIDRIDECAESEKLVMDDLEHLSTVCGSAEVIWKVPLVSHQT